MKTSPASKAPNNAEALLKNIYSINVDKASHPVQQAHKEIHQSAARATQLLDQVASVGEMLKHPVIVKAKSYHAELIALAQAITVDGNKFKDELIKLHKRYLTSCAEDLVGHDQIDLLNHQLQVHEAYYNWITNFGSTVLVTLEQLTNRIQYILALPESEIK